MKEVDRNIFMEILENVIGKLCIHCLYQKNTKKNPKRGFIPGFWCKFLRLILNTFIPKMKVGSGFAFTIVLNDSLVESFNKETFTERTASLTEKITIKKKIKMQHVAIQENIFKSREATKLQCG